MVVFQEGEWIFVLNIVVVYLGDYFGYCGFCVIVD